MKQQSLSQHQSTREGADELNGEIVADNRADYDTVNVIAELEQEMRVAAAKLEFERAAHLRDQIKQLKATGEKPSSSEPSSS